MKIRVRHEVPGRVRFAVDESLGFAAAVEQIERAVSSLAGVRSVRVSVETGSVVVDHDGLHATRSRLVHELSALRLEPSAPSRKLAGSEVFLRERRGLLIRSIFISAVSTAFPPPLRAAIALVRSAPLLMQGLRVLFRRQMDSDVLDAAAVTTALARGDSGTASSISLLLQLGDYIRLRTESHASRDLAATLGLENRTVWIRRDGIEVEIDAREVRSGDTVVVRTGHMVPVDGRVVAGAALIEQSSLTGESLPVARRAGARVFEGTTVVEGAIDVEALEVGEHTRRGKIVRLIEQAENQKAAVQARADRLADRLVPWVFGTAGLTLAATGNATRAASVLLVDYSCALKISTPISVRSCMAEALRGGVLLRGGKFVEALAEVDTVVVDKTGTLTEARPRVVDVLAFDGFDPDELLRETACVEEHFPHPFANAIVQEAQRRGLAHQYELHGEVKYLVAQGIVSVVNGKRFVVGSKRFLCDSGVRIDDEQLAGLDEGYSLVYVAVEDRLAGVVRLEDPVRAEAAETLLSLRALGIREIVLLTGDTRENARRVAAVGVDAWHGEVSPEDKVRLVEELKARGRKVAMIGDGVNDAAALSAAHVGISFQYGADLAKEVADVLILREDLRCLPWAIRLSRRAMSRLHSNFGLIGSINSALIGLGIVGVVPPAISAVLHNGTTILTSLRSLRPYLENARLGAASENVTDMLRVRRTVRRRRPAHRAA